MGDDKEQKGRGELGSPQGHKRDSGAEAHPWGRRGPPWDPHLGSWVQDTGTVCKSHWGLEQAATSSRTLSHPSFQSFFATFSAHRGACLPAPGGRMGPLPTGGPPLPLADGHSCFYTDPTLPAGCRIYNRLSASSQEVLRGLPLNTPAPIMCPRPASPASRRWLSDLECQALLALLALPAGTSTGPAPGAAQGPETEPPAACPEAPQQAEGGPP
ncbi:uncharacterized protein LOC143825058 isoform X2 [Paroedura picta]|uniref:uncharacterized protein LOC143825058 isoform X2 n=1 Tax=Paroedura picta TaxID=143630 RepID=UPI004056014B